MLYVNPFYYISLLNNLYAYLSLLFLDPNSIILSIIVIRLKDSTYTNTPLGTIFCSWNIGSLIKKFENIYPFTPIKKLLFAPIYIDFISNGLIEYFLYKKIIFPLQSYHFN